KQIFTILPRDVVFGFFPTNRAWMMVVRNESDGMFALYRTSERERFCSFPDEPLIHDKWVFFVRAADTTKLSFSSVEDLVGYNIAIRALAPGALDQRTFPSQLRQVLREHNNVVETSGARESLRLLAGGRVDYAIVSLVYGMSEIANMGLSE